MTSKGPARTAWRRAAMEVRQAPSLAHLMVQMVKHKGEFESLAPMLRCGARLPSELVELLVVRGTKVLGLLLPSGLSTELRNRRGGTLLMVAVAHPKPESRAPLIELLLQHGADIEARDIEGATALMRAAADRCGDSVAALLASGADINAQDPWGRTALHWAAQGNACRAIRELLKQGTDLEARDGAGMTALFLAATLGKANAVKVLLELGANTSALNAFGQTLDDCIELHAIRKVIAEHEQSAPPGKAAARIGK